MDLFDCDVGDWSASGEFNTLGEVRVKVSDVMAVGRLDYVGNVAPAGSKKSWSGKLYLLLEWEGDAKPAAEKPAAVDVVVPNPVPSATSRNIATGPKRGVFEADNLSPRDPNASQIRGQEHARAKEPSKLPGCGVGEETGKGGEGDEDYFDAREGTEPAGERPREEASKRIPSEQRPSPSDPASRKSLRRQTKALELPDPVVARPVEGSQSNVSSINSDYPPRVPPCKDDTDQVPESYPNLNP